MSFGAVFAGRHDEVSEAIAREDGSPFTHGGDLGALTREYLGKVAALSPADKRLIVEASGHVDAHTVSLNVRVVTVHS